MKKLMLGACAVLALAAASCGKCDNAAKCEAAATDSLSTAYGTYVGSMINGEFAQFNSNEKGKQEFLRGMQIVFGSDESRETRMGMDIANKLMTEISQLKEQGIEMNKAAVMQAFKKAFLADSMDFMQVQANAGAFQDLYRAAQDRAEAAKAAEADAEPAAEANVEAGVNYIAKLRADGTDVKTTDNGLSYTITEEGTGAKPEETATVVVNYTGKHLNGEVFDSTDGRGPATFNLQGVVPGFREGLMLLGKGGKATLYIPGNLAYGAQGAPQAGIGPNEMLVFDVELLDINPAE